MTNEERMKAFSMRLDGCSWEKIAEELHYSTSTVAHDIVNCVNGHRRSTCPCIYPAITKVLQQEYYGSISRLSAVSHIPYSTLLDCLTGRHHSPKTAARISALLGLPPEVAFAKEDTT